MSSDILEFYIDKEKRELINTINSAKYISEEQKESIIGVLEVSDKWLKDKEDKADMAGKTHHADKLSKHRHDPKRATRQVNRRDAEEYYKEHGKLGGSFARDFRIKDGKVVPKGNF